MNNIPCMTGIETKDIPQKPIVPPYANMDLHPTIACPFNCLKGNSRFFKCNHLYTKPPILIGGFLFSSPKGKIISS